MHQGDISAQANLMGLRSTKHLYALGALENLKGEFLILNGQPHIAVVKSETLTIGGSFDHKATLLVYATVAQWQSLTIPDSIASYPALETFIAHAAQASGISTDKPFPFMMEGHAQSFDWHVIDWPEGDSEHSHNKHITSGLYGKLTGKEVQILGFYSDRHHGVFTHHSTNMHMHVMTRDGSVCGHLDDLTPGHGMTLKLPAAD